MSVEDETQQIPAVGRAAPPAGNDPTSVLRLDELFEVAAEPVPRPAAVPAPAPALAARLRADAAAAWSGTRRRSGAWLRSGDNPVVLLTGLVAVLLLLAVAMLSG